MDVVERLQLRMMRQYNVHGGINYVPQRLMLVKAELSILQ